MLEMPSPSALNMAWWSQCIRDMSTNPPKHTTPPSLKMYEQREKISPPVKDDLNSCAPHLLYIFKSICFQHSEPVAKHKFSFTCTILRVETLHQWVSNLRSNIQSWTTVIFPKEQWSMTVWSEQQTVRGLFQSPWHWLSVWILSYSIITLFISVKGYVWRDTLKSGVQRSVQTRGEAEIFSRLIVSKLQQKNQ